MFRIFLAVIVCVFMFSIFQLFNVIELANSHPNDTNPNDPAGTQRANKYNNINKIKVSMLDRITLRKQNLVVAQSVIIDLNTNWKANETAIKEGSQVTITAALKTLFGTIGAIATGGKSLAANVAVTGPTFINASKTYKAASKTDRAILMRYVFVNAYVKALEGYDAAITFHKTDHDYVY